MSDPAETPEPPVAGTPALPGVDSPPAEDVLDSAPSKEEVVDGAPSPEEIVRGQPSVDEILGSDR